MSAFPYPAALNHQLSTINPGFRVKLVVEGFGNPHAHTGLSIRKLGRHVYECRTGLAWRLIFLADKGVLSFDFAGDHDELQNYLRGMR